MNRGFSLVELSIVLVILGLLTGGILSGQSLIRAAELRSVSTDAQRYHSAIMSFRDKYFALPGDMRSAVKFWGAAAGSTADGTDAACQALTTPSTTAATCNGNGDGNVATTVENFRVWQHLTNAGLVEGTFTGVADPAGSNLSTPGLNVPQLRIPRVGASILTSNVVTTESGSWFKTSRRLLLSIGRAFTNSETRIGFMKPEEAWNIDTKMDDGRPAYGKMQSRNDTGCTTTAITETAEYALSGADSDCIFRYFMD